MRLKDRRAFSKPEVMIIPMIDIMFFLLVFFMLSTMYMVEQKTIPVNLPQATSAVRYRFPRKYIATGRMASFRLFPQRG